MNRFFITLVGFLFFCGVFAFANGTASPLRAEPAEVDLGQAGQRQIREAKVRLINSGNESVEVAFVSTNCGCTTASLSKIRLSRGEEAVLTIKLETRLESGKINRRVIVHASSGDVAIAVKLVVVPSEIP